MKPPNMLTNEIKAAVLASHWKTNKMLCKVNLSLITDELMNWNIEWHATELLRDHVYLQLMIVLLTTQNQQHLNVALRRFLYGVPEA